jgi:hypothetical protein
VSTGKVMAGTLSLPFQGSTQASAHASYTGAVEAAKTRAIKRERYLAILAERGPMTDQAVHDLTGWPLSSVNSTRCGCGNRVVPRGHEPSPFRRAQRTRWGLSTR